jgi:2-methylisocitrate lyase-like PEP mutase family enzyme
MNRPGDVLRGLLAERELVRAPEALTPLMAVAVQQAGFEAMYLGGGSSAALHHALPDIGLVAPIELQPLAASLTAVADIPLIVDLDHGADTTLGVGRVVRCFEDAGAAAIHLEDTSGNKKVKGLTSLVSVDAFRANIASAVSACRQGMMVIARSDAWMTGGQSRRGG